MTRKVIFEIIDAKESSHHRNDDVKNLIKQTGLTNKKWSCNGKEEYCILDLGEAKDVAGIDIAWFDGKIRRQQFEIHGGDMPDHLARHAASISSGTTDHFEEITFERPRKMRYLKLMNLGNTLNDFMSIRGIQVFGYSDEKEEWNEGGQFGIKSMAAAGDPSQSLKTSESQND
jgi:hypothetical protein